MLSVDDLRVTGSLSIPAAELHWRFDPSGGPGGQHANKASTRVELSFDVSESAAFDEPTRTRVLSGLGDRVRDGVVTVQVNESRSQWRNRQLARRRLADLIVEALRPPPAPRRPTRPTRASRQRRLDSKRRRSEIKRLRRRPDAD